MLGHRDPHMTVRDQHLSPEHLHDAAKALDERCACGSSGGRRAGLGT